MPEPSGSLRIARIALPSATVLAIGWALFLVYAYPGYMTTDSVEQLLQARSGVYNDWHPPLMSWIWAGLERLVVTGPLGMLLLQSGLFLGGAFVLIRRVAPALAAAVLASAVLLFPAVLTTMAVIWKDSQMAGFLMMGMALLLSRNAYARAGGLLSLLVACGLRHNAAAAVAPLLLYAVWSGSRPWWQRVGVAALLTLALFVASGVVNRALTDERTYTWHVSLALHDLAGTMVGEGPAGDDEILQRLDGVPLTVRENLYERIRGTSPRTWWPLNHGKATLFEPVTTEAQRTAIARAWQQTVVRDPGAYLRHRAAVFVQFLGLDRSAQLWSPVYHGLADSPESLRALDLHASTSRTQEWLYEILDRHQNSPMFRPYVYLFASIAAFLVCAVRRRGYELAFLSSGLCYELAYFFVAPTADNRYSHWMFCCFAMAVTIAAADAWGRRRGSLRADDQSS